MVKSVRVGKGFAQAVVMLNLGSRRVAIDQQPVL